MKTAQPLKFEKFRAIRSGSSSAIATKGIDDVLADLERVCYMISTEMFSNALTHAIGSLHFNLKLMGHQMENMYKDVLNKRFGCLRDGCRDRRLDRSSRVRLLELVELRANCVPWTLNETTAQYYRQALQIIETEAVCDMMSAARGPAVGGMVVGAAPVVDLLPPILAPGEVVRSSGRYPRPARAQNKCRDEVVIRNADSGKVMGMKGLRVHKIEELSQTVISFQRVPPGAKERLVQITGPEEDNVLRARELIEEVIRRNASPVRGGVAEESSICYPPPQMTFYPTTAIGGGTVASDGSISSGHSDEHRRQLVDETLGVLGMFKYTVFVGDESIKLTGKHANLVKTAKLVLDEYFSAVPADYINMESGMHDPAAQMIGAGDCVTTTCESLLTPNSQSAAPKFQPLTVTPSGQNDKRQSTEITIAEDAATVEAHSPKTSGGDKHIDLTNGITDNYVGDDSVRTVSVVPAPAAVGDEGSSVVSRRQYSRQQLLMYSRSAVARYSPRGWQKVRQLLPNIARQTAKPFDVDAFVSRTSADGGKTDSLTVITGAAGK